MSDGEKFLIQLKAKTTIPSEAFVVSEEGSFSRVELQNPGEFAAPWFQKPNGFTEPPIWISNGGLEHTQLEAGMLYLDFHGRIFVDPRRIKKSVAKDGKRKTEKRIKKHIDSLPTLWEWGVKIRSEQDRILEEVRVLLPEWEIDLPERDRIFLNHSKIGEIEECLKNFSEAGKEIPIGKCSIGKVLALFEEEWRRIKEDEKAEEPSQKEVMDKKFQDILKEKEEILPFLKKAGLI